MAEGVLLAIGGVQGRFVSKETSSIYGLHGDDKKWKHVEDMPFACSLVDTLLLSDGGLLVVDGCNSRQVLRIIGKSKKEADERYEGTWIQWIENWVRVLGEVGLL